VAVRDATHDVPFSFLPLKLNCARKGRTTYKRRAMQILGPTHWFSFRGRARRGEYVLQTAVLVALSKVSGYLARAAIDAGMGGDLPLAAAMLFMAVSLVASWAVIFRRLHDFGVHGREVLLPLLCAGGVVGLVAWRTGWAPSATLWIVTNLALSVPLIAIPSAIGTNEFGPPSRKAVWRATQRDAP
jgi:uncharacterized membrane protein YhaH (DUF805 family)